MKHLREEQAVPALLADHQMSLEFAALLECQAAIEIPFRQRMLVDIPVVHFPTRLSHRV